MLLDIRYRLESVIDQLGAHYGLALRLLFEGVRIFELFLQLADFLVELADLFSQLYGIVWLPRNQLSLQRLRLLLHFLLDPADHFFLSLSPDHVKVLQKLIDQVR